MKTHWKILTKIGNAGILLLNLICSFEDWHNGSKGRRHHLHKTAPLSWQLHNLCRRPCLPWRRTWHPFRILCPTGAGHDVPATTTNHARCLRFLPQCCCCPSPSPPKKHHNNSCWGLSEEWRTLNSPSFCIEGTKKMNNKK